MIAPTLVWALTALLAAAPAEPPRALSAQPAGERARQNLMPQSPDPLWRTLAHTRVSGDPAKGVFTADHPADVRALNGREVAVEGFMLPTGFMPPFSYFVLTRYTPVCAFCPPGAPNEAMEVNLTEFTKPVTGLISVRGKLHINSDGASGLFFRLDDAHIEKAAS